MQGRSAPVASSVEQAMQQFAAGQHVVCCIQGTRAMLCVTAAEAEMFYLGERYLEVRASCP